MNWKSLGLKKRKQEKYDFCWLGMTWLPGGDTSYKWANGDVPLDGVACSRLD